MEKNALKFVNQLDEVIEPLYKNCTLSFFNASISGKPEDYDKSASAQLELEKIFMNQENFLTVENFFKTDSIQDPVLKRRIYLYYHAFLARQADHKTQEEIINLQNSVEQAFSTFRAEVNGQKRSDNEIDKILKESSDSIEVERAWKASKAIGCTIEKDVLKLVEMRNQIAAHLGFKNYHDMSLIMSEQNPDEIESIFNELEKLTRPVFIKEKEKIDQFLAEKFSLPISELRAWHYQNKFFQQGPEIFEIDFDTLYQDKDLVAIAKQFYEGIGLPIEEILEKSDLFEKEGKYQHAYCIDIDKSGDVRMVCNIKANNYWMNTLLHEAGHAVFSKNIDKNLPYTLRGEAHIFVTEAIAMFFGKLASNSAWLKDFAGLDAAQAQELSDASFRMIRLDQLVFCRWMMVMYHFEKSLYANPNQNLNKLWWDLVEKYQMITVPKDRNEPDWTTKVHIATSPCYYHNYMLGELLSCQLNHYVVKNIVKSDDLINQRFMNQKELGKYLKEKIFEPGESYFWNELIEKACGEPLSPAYFVELYSKE